MGNVRNTGSRWASPAKHGPAWLRRIAAECREKLRHLRLRGYIEAYMDGALTSHRKEQVAAHLATCWTCSGTAETLRLIKHSLRRSPRRIPASLSEARLRRFAGQLARNDRATPR